MDGNPKNYWGHQDLHRVCFGLSAGMDHDLRELQQQHMAQEFNSSISYHFPAFCSEAYRPASGHALRPCEGDQVVPSSQRRGRQKEAKPLPPPPPDPEDLMSDEAADSEVEFFTSDRQRLLPKSCPKAITRGSDKDCGQVNAAYQGSSLGIRPAGRDSVAFSWPSREDRPLGRGGRMAVNNLHYFAHEKRDNRHEMSAVMAAFEKNNQNNPSRHPETHFPLRGLFLNPKCAYPHPPEKPQIPPRIPIPPKPSTLTKPGSRNEDEKAPQSPPKGPLGPTLPTTHPEPQKPPNLYQRSDACHTELRC